MKVFSIARCDVQTVRGTPLRIKSIQQFLAQRKDIELHTATFNQELDYSDRHLPITRNFWRNLPKLIQYTKAESVDVVICHTILAYPAIIAMRLFTGTKVILEMHGFFEIEQFEFGNFTYAQKLKSHIVFWLAYKACHLITTCSDTATNILKRYNKNVITIWGGVNLAYFNPDTKPGNSIDNTSKIIIGYAGNARQYQGLPFLLKAFRQIRKLDGNFMLAILSSDILNDEYGEDVRVFQKIPHKEVPSFLAECDILVIPRTNSEVNRISFPSKLLEYMATGKVVVGSKTSDIDHIIIHKKNGLIFNPEDTDDFIKLILSLKDNVERQRMGHMAYITARDNYTWEHQTDILTKSMRALLDTE